MRELDIHRVRKPGNINQKQTFFVPPHISVAPVYNAPVYVTPVCAVPAHQPAQGLAPVKRGGFRWKYVLAAVLILAVAGDKPGPI